MERCPCDCSKLPSFTKEEAKAAYRAIQPLSMKYIEEKAAALFFTSLQEGMNVELEHCDITCGDPIMTAKIALAHLREDPLYYEKLKKAWL